MDGPTDGAHFSNYLLLLLRLDGGRSAAQKVVERGLSVSVSPLSSVLRERERESERRDYDMRGLPACLSARPPALSALHRLRARTLATATDGREGPRLTMYSRSVRRAADND